jgi:glucoamylase
VATTGGYQILCSSWGSQYWDLAIAKLGSSITVVSALVVASPNRFVAHDNGYAGTPSDCSVDLGAHKTLQNQFDTITGKGNFVQCGKIGSLGADTTFTVALGYGSDAATAIAKPRTAVAGTGISTASAQPQPALRVISGAAEPITSL